MASEPFDARLRTSLTMAPTHAYTCFAMHSMSTGVGISHRKKRGLRNLMRHLSGEDGPRRHHENKREGLPLPAGSNTWLKRCKKKCRPGRNHNLGLNGQRHDSKEGDRRPTPQPQMSARDGRSAPQSLPEGIAASQQMLRITGIEVCYCFHMLYALKSCKFTVSFADLSPRFSSRS